MKYILMALVKLYQKLISRFTKPKCKYYPTCSRYALDALERYGAVRGLALAVWRLLRCNPWSMGGIDPVPEKFTFKVNKIDPADLDSLKNAKPLSEIQKNES